MADLSRYPFYLLLGDFMGSLVRIGRMLYLPRRSNPTPPVTHEERVSLYTFLGTLNSTDRETFDQLAQDLELSMRFMGLYGKRKFHRKFCDMLQIAHRVRKLY